jgi:hypothetical protein
MPVNRELNPLQDGYTPTEMTYHDERMSVDGC